MAQNLYRNGEIAPLSVGNLITLNLKHALRAKCPYNRDHAKYLICKNWPSAAAPDGDPRPDLIIANHGKTSISAYFT